MGHLGSHEHKCELLTFVLCVQGGALNNLADMKPRWQWPGTVGSMPLRNYLAARKKKEEAMVSRWNHEALSGSIAFVIQHVLCDRFMLTRICDTHCVFAEK